MVVLCYNERQLTFINTLFPSSLSENSLAKWASWSFVKILICLTAIQKRFEDMWLAA